MLQWCDADLLELQQIVSTPCDSEDLIDNVLRAYLGLTVRYKGLSFDLSRYYKSCGD